MSEDRATEMQRGVETCPRPGLSRDAVMVSEQRSFVSAALARGQLGQCQIYALPGLHERRNGYGLRSLTGATAKVLEFPAPRWQRNARARS